MKTNPAVISASFALGLLLFAVPATSRADILYVSNDNSIEEFGPNGVGTVFANSGLNHPMFIAIQVPEPSTGAMLAMGIGAVLGGLRLRRPYAVIRLEEWRI